MLYYPPTQALDANGNPIAGAKLNIFASGTSTPETVYSDAAGTTPLPNPIVADSGGYFPAYYSDVENLKLVLTDATDVTIYTVDPAAGIRLAQVSPGIVDTATGPRMEVQDTGIWMEDPVLLGRLTEEPKAYLHIVRGLASPPGTVAAPSNADAFMIEGDATTGGYFFTPDDDPARILWGAPADAAYAEIAGVVGPSAGPFLDITVGGKLNARYTKDGPLGGAVMKTDVFVGTVGTGSWEDVTDLEITVTPPSTTSRFELTCSGTMSNDTNNGRAFGRFVRDGTAVGVGDAAGSRIPASVQADSIDLTTSDSNEAFGVTIYDTPGVVTPVVYKFQVRSENFGNATIGRGGLDTDNTNSGRYGTSFSVKLF